MSNYFSIQGSPAEIIGVATNITAKAHALESDLRGLLATIKSLESDGVIGTDDFAAEFVKTYRQDTPVATGTAWATDATKDASVSLATSSGQLGDAVSSTMQDYLVTDGQGAADINSVQTTQT
ncbi:hypothetical protein [Dactylosporangium sp. CA-139066]|uniref:hypothetical protein n=1 Tax=Dactylosporangium sp. CA-139066 TaxID=3239930 RepID=UPI003D9203DF